MAIVKELKNLGKKMTGADLTGNTVSEALKAIEEKYAGSSGETFETAFELNVGAMEPMGDADANLYGASVQVASVPTDSVLYFGSVDYPMPRESYDGMPALYRYNISLDTGKKEEEDKPAYALMFRSESQEAYLCTVISDSPDLSNTTIRILKKASAPSGGSDRLVVTLTKTGTGSEAVYSADKSYHEIKAALDAKRDVEVLYPYDFDGALTDPLIVHLFPLGYQAINETVSLIGFASLPTYSENGFSSVSVTCQYNSTLDATTWNVAWNGIAQSKEFAFTATPDGQGGFTVTPGDGVTYVAILNAMASSPLVFAIVSTPALNSTVIAQFNAKSSVSGNGVVSASIVGYFNSTYCIMELYMRSDGTSGVNVVPLPTQS